MVEYKKGFHPIYLSAIIYVIGVYIAAVVCIAGFIAMNIQTAYDFTMDLRVLWVPLLMGIVNLAVIIYTRKKDKQYFLNCSAIIKYLLTPFYIIGGISILVLSVISIITLGYCMIVFPKLAIAFGMFGYTVLVASAPFPILYIVKAVKDGTHNLFLGIIGILAQFFFCTDVLAVMILALKEKKCVKSTVAVGMLSVFCFISAVVVPVIKNIAQR